MDRAEQIVASKRLAAWSPSDQSFVADLPDDEREVVGLLAAYLDAKPVPASTGAVEGADGA